MTKQNSNPQDLFEDLLEFLKTKRGFDFTGYKRASLRRRIARRIQAVQVETPADYIDYLEVHPEEFIELFNMILINVTTFFRDPQTWEYLDKKIIPAILAEKRPDEPIRIWCAGAASGEETCTIAMLMAEHLGVEGFKKRVKIYATDLDEDALSRARVAGYSAEEVKDIPPDLLEKYFEVNGPRYAFNKDLRRSIIFGRHNLIQDAPISRIDLLICRNVLMYLNAETQAVVLSRMYFALNDTGFLFLGKAEMLFTHTRMFSPVDLKQRVFAKVLRNGDRDHVLVNRSITNGDNDSIIFTTPRLREAAFENGLVAQLVLDSNGTLVLANRQVRELFGLAPSDLGRSFQELRISYQPVDLRSAIDTVSQPSSEPVVIKEVYWETPLMPDRYMNMIVAALVVEGEQVGISISFSDITQHKHMQTQLEHTNQELETAMEELESTNEELETTNEELQSTIEELETTNEELQSTNEELETMNEELQSSNEELETMNDEMTQQSIELNHAYAFLTSILSGIDASVIVVGQDLLVQVWNKTSEELWGLRSEEVLGRSLFGLDIGLPVERLKKPILNVLNHDGTGMEEVTVNAINRRGKKMRVKAKASHLVNRDKQINGAIIIIDQVQELEE